MKQEAKLALEAAVRRTVLQFPEKTGNVVNRGKCQIPEIGTQPIELARWLSLTKLSVVRLRDESERL